MSDVKQCDVWHSGAQCLLAAGHVGFHEIPDEMKNLQNELSALRLSHAALVEENERLRDALDGKPHCFGFIACGERADNVTPYHCSALCHQTESWRRANHAWQSWAADVLHRTTAQPAGGEWGDGKSRELISASLDSALAEVARMTAVYEAALAWAKEGDGGDDEIPLLNDLFELCERALATTPSTPPGGGE